MKQKTHLQKTMWVPIMHLTYMNRQTATRFIPKVCSPDRIRRNVCFKGSETCSLIRSKTTPAVWFGPQYPTIHCTPATCSTVRPADQLVHLLRCDFLWVSHGLLFSAWTCGINLLLWLTSSVQTGPSSLLAVWGKLPSGKLMLLTLRVKSEHLNAPLVLVSVRLDRRGRKDSNVYRL